MNLVARQIYGDRKYKPNTFIGGVSATINTPALVASKLGISETRIKGFRIVGSNIEFAVIGAAKYTLPINCFTGNTSITYFYDDALLVNYIGMQAFYNCTNFADFRLNALLGSLGNAESLFRNTALVSASFPSATGVGANFGKFTFQDCPKLESVDFGIFTGPLGDTFRNSKKVHTVLCKAPTYSGTFRDGGANVPFYNEYVITVGNFSFSLNCGFTDITLPNATTIANEAFYRGASNNTLKTLIAQKVVSIGVNGGNGLVFARNTGMTLIDIRACKNFYGTSNFLSFNYSICTIKVHIYMATSNSGGADSNLTIFKSGGGVVEFYDDLGNYVSTL
jgi:hypothetical protein